MTLAELEQQRAARLDRDALPLTMTHGEADAYVKATADLDARIRTAKNALTTLASVGSDDADTQWLDFLGPARKALCDERMQIKSPIRDPKVLGRAKNLEFSIDYIDKGPTRAFTDSGYALETLRLGQLMIEAGYPLSGADPSRNYHGELTWFGSVKEAEKRIADREKKRAQAERALDAALMDDDVREKQEADAKALRDAFNSMRVKVGADPNVPGLRVVDRENQDIDEGTLTPLQQKALALAREAMRAAVTQ